MPIAGAASSALRSSSTRSQAIAEMVIATAEIIQIELLSSILLISDAIPRLTVSWGKTTDRLNKPINIPICVLSTFWDMIAKGRLTIDAHPIPMTAISTK